MPQSVEQWLEVAREFERRWQFPHCLGAVDGKHVQIIAPPSSGSSYYNYKGFHSIVLLAIADADCNFLAVDVGCNGRISDGGVFAKSPIASLMDNPMYGWPRPSVVRGIGVPIPYFLIGDDAFPLRTSLVKPYSHRQLNRPERVFNYRLSRARRVVENAFGLLVARFRILQRPINLVPAKADMVVLACCALHNFLRKHDTARSTYSASGSVDVEDEDTGYVRPGTWRAQEASWATKKIWKQGTNNASKEAMELRDHLHDYVNFCNKLPWQDRTVK